MFVNTIPTRKSCNYTRKSNQDRIFQSNILRVITIVLLVIWPVDVKILSLTCKTDETNVLVVFLITLRIMNNNISACLAKYVALN